MKALNIKALFVAAVVAVAFAVPAQAEVRFGSGFSTSTTKTVMTGQVKVTGVNTKSYTADLTGVRGNYAAGSACGSDCYSSTSQTGQLTTVANIHERENSTTNVNVLQNIDAVTTAANCDSYVDFGGMKIGHSSGSFTSNQNVIATDNSVTTTTGYTSMTANVYDSGALIGNITEGSTTNTVAVSDLTTKSTTTTRGRTVASYFGK